ncbi:hypothetical protein EST38_g9042 [Candolleomyces aberdarensis]|uniref:Uncharacterized protein n=1 Tax=Candolleomyces aberdarensis TaxID=2316362 RepID=A0A4Q2DDU9_9AGAR|nr:hypothetical protein EST38_g9042 [Candolleomyces aberdarensis]
MPGYKPSPQFIKSSAYSDRCVDLEGGVSTAPLIGFELHRGENQRFTFSSLGGKDYNISVLTASGHPTNVSSQNPAAGDKVKTSNVENSVYQVQKNNGYWYISIMCADGYPLYWTLKSDASLTRITLERADNSPNQAWSLLDAQI